MPHTKKKQLTEEEFHAALGQRIKELRRRAGKTSEALAYEIEMSRSLLNGYENGKGMVTTNLNKIINGLGVTVEEFFSEGFTK